MTDQELLLAMSNMIDSKMVPVTQQLNTMSQRLDTMDQRMDALELQIKSTERVLKNEIRKSEALILDEVERVHNILDKHMHDITKHTA